MRGGDGRRAFLMALGCVLAWSTAATAFEIGLETLRPAALLFWSSSVSALALGVAVVLRRSRPQPGGLRRGLLLGLLAPGLYYLVLFEAYARLPAQEAQTLNYTWPMSTLLLSALLLGERPRPASWAALLLGLLGVAVVASGGRLLSWRLEDPLGVALALASGLIWGLFWVLQARAPRDPARSLLGASIGGAALAGLAATLREETLIGDGRAAAAALWIGLFEMGPVFLLWLGALRCAERVEDIGSLPYLGPFLSLGWIALILGEEILPSTWIGLSLVVGGILLQRRLDRRGSSRARPAPTNLGPEDPRP